MNSAFFCSDEWKAGKTREVDSPIENQIRLKPPVGQESLFLQLGQLAAIPPRGFSLHFTTLS